MKVKELIAILSEYDPDAVIQVNDSDHGMSDPEVDWYEYPVGGRDFPGVARERILVVR